MEGGERRYVIGGYIAWGVKVDESQAVDWTRPGKIAPHDSAPASTQLAKPPAMACIESRPRLALIEVVSQVKLLDGCRCCVLSAKASSSEDISKRASRLYSTTQQGSLLRKRKS